MQKIFFEILVLTALTVGLIWTILELTPKSALLSLTILYFKAKLRLEEVDIQVQNGQGVLDSLISFIFDIQLACEAPWPFWTFIFISCI